MLREWQDYMDHYQSRNASSYCASLTPSVPPQPRFDISREQLQYLHSMSFTWVQISELLGVSRMTIYRRRQDYGMGNDPSEDITNELREVLQEMRRELPSLGQTMVWGRLFKVTLARVREAMRVSDPINTALGNLWQAISIKTTKSPRRLRRDKRQP